MPRTLLFPAFLVGARGFEPPTPTVSSAEARITPSQAVESALAAALGTIPGSPTFEHLANGGWPAGDPIETALSKGIEGATVAGEWATVAKLAGELEASPTAGAGERGRPRHSAAQPEARPMSIIDQAALEALIRKIAHEEARPMLVNQRAVAAVLGMSRGNYLGHCRAGDWPSFADRRVRYSRTADVVVWLTRHPVTPRRTLVAVACNEDEEARLLARVGARRVARSAVSFTAESRRAAERNGTTCHPTRPPTNEHENESHDTLLQWIEQGRAAIISDEQERRGRFQIAAVLSGDPSGRFTFVLTQWHQDGKGDWRSTKCMLLDADAAARLIDLVRSATHSPKLERVK